ncbi:MAG: flavin reductase family protein [Gemmatimonadetes bacterium]|nr:flavin reductase family protein [Gemmatimonadota bacterium]
MGHREAEGQPATETASGASLRAVMAAYPTGVTIVATRDPAGAPLGLTVNTFTSVSLDPPLVLICIGRSSASHDRIIAAGTFAVSMLSEAQAELSRRFARQPSEGRFDGVAWWQAPSGNPVLEGATAWIDCSIDQVMEAGDHTIILGRARSCGATDTPPLLFHRGALASVRP